MNARRSILILGWDIDSRFELTREKTSDGFPTALCDFLDTLVQRRPELEIHVLNWDYSLILAPDREWVSKVKFDWSTHERMHFKLDRHFPTGASHHQKVAVVDDKVAFVGGLDFTHGRWDASKHRADDHRRADTDGEIPQPYHDVQVMVSGKIAADLGDLCRQRWKTATGEELSAPEVKADSKTSTSRHHQSATPWQAGSKSPMVRKSFWYCLITPSAGCRRTPRCRSGRRCLGTGKPAVVDRCRLGASACRPDPEPVTHAGRPGVGRQCTGNRHR